MRVPFEVPVGSLDALQEYLFIEVGDFASDGPMPDALIVPGPALSISREKDARGWRVRDRSAYGVSMP